MSKVYIQNLGMITTNQCNLDCKHCFRGCKNNQVMSQEVAEATLDQVVGVGNLCICGGEPTFALEILEFIFQYIVSHKILVDFVTITINGTNYSVEFLRLLDYMNDYIVCRTNSGGVMFSISYDPYHRQEVERLGLLEVYIENIQKYAESKYFYDLRLLDPHVRLFREGNAEMLDPRLTVDLKPIDIVVTYIGKKGRFDRNGICNIGPMITVNTEGMITEDNASFEHQKTIYNYGNVFIHSFEEVALSRGKIVKPKQYLKKTDQIINKYTTY